MDLLISLAARIIVFYVLLLSLNLIVGKTRIWAFGHVGFFGLGMFFAVFFPIRFGWDPWAAIAVTVVGGTICALLMGMVSLGLEREPFIVVNLFFAQLVYALTVSLGGPRGFYGFPRPSGWYQILRSDAVFAIVCLLPVALGTRWLFRRVTSSPLHRVGYFISSFPAVAALFGYHPRRYSLAMFAAGSSIAVLAGVVYAWLVGGTDPSLATPYAGMMVFAMILLGGVDSLVGTAVASVLLVALPTVISFAIQFSPRASYFAGQVSQLIFGLLLVGCIRYLPGGIAGGSTSWSRSGY